MRVYGGIEQIGNEGRPSAVTIGNFDGVHTAHRELLRRVVEEAARRQAHAAVLTFDPHPVKVLSPARAPRLLTTMEARLELMRQAGIEQVLIIPFSLEFARITAEEFVSRILVQALGARAVVVGENFRFGHQAAGDVALLTELGRRYRFDTIVVPGLTIRGRLASSTAVRERIDAGDVSTAFRLLGRAYEIEGGIVRGHGIGSKQTVPTLNLDSRAEIIPAPGVYITRTADLDRDRQWNSITNVGYRPTFEGEGLTIETFLLDPLAGDPPERIRLAFYRRVRAERKFDSPAELKAQILKDVGRAQTWFRRLRRASAVH